MGKYDGLTRQELSSLVDDRAWDLQKRAEETISAINMANYREVYSAIDSVRRYADILEEAVEALEEQEQKEEGEEYELRNKS